MNVSRRTHPRDWLTSRLVALVVAAALIASTPGLAPSVSAQDVDDAAVTSDAETLAVEPTASEVSTEPIAYEPVPEEIPVDEPEPLVEETIPPVEDEWSTVDEETPPVEEVHPTETATAIVEELAPTEDAPVVEETSTAEPTIESTMPADIPSTSLPKEPVRITDPDEIDASSPTVEPSPTTTPRRSSRQSAQLGAAAVTLTVTLALAPTGSTAAGTSVTGTLSWANASAGAPTGTVKYRVFTGSSCTGVLYASAGTKTIDATTFPSGRAPVSDAVVMNAAGAHSWQAVYGGDVNYNASTACVNQTIVKRTPTIALSVAPSPSIAGTALTGTSNLSNLTTTATGNLTYTVYANSLCTTQVSPAQASARTVAGAVVPTSAPLTVQQAGTVYWRAVYTGDANNNAATSPCQAVTVSKAAPAVALAVAPGTVNVWESAGATATLSGTATGAAGTLLYTVYADVGCTTAVSPAKTSSRTVTGGVVPASASFMFTDAGVVYWEATYGGDANNSSAESACLPMTVVGGSLAISVASVTMAPVTYSVSEQTNTGVMVLNVVDRRGTSEGWSVTLAVSDFTYTGTSPTGANIPAGAFRIDTAYGPVYVHGQAISGANGPAIPSGGATDPLDTPVVVLVAADGYGAGEYTQTYDVALVIPAGSQVGTYTAVIDSTTSAAP